MRFTSIRPRLWLLALAIFAFSGLAAAEPPSRAARLSYISGNVSFSPAGESGWVRAVLNRPLTSGDRLWVDAGSRAELQVGGAAIRLGAATSLVLLNLDDSIVQMELDQGTLNVRVRRMGPTQAFEVDTPNLAFSMRGPGNYRVDADPGADATTVRAHSGRAEVYGDRASYAVMAGQGYRFYGTGLADYERLATWRDDEFDRWARERDRRIEAARSARYVSPDVVGYEELDAYGTWGNDPDYGYVWQPSRVASGWTPYRDGHWAWIDPWGWTWVDDAPWGYAVSHYGRWANRRGAWVWVPGPQRAQAVYAPALVSFVDGRNLAAATAIGAAIAWFALAPREVYRPSYPVSRSYFDRINRSNTVVAPATITNIYNIHQAARPGAAAPARTIYANQRVPGAVVAVPAQAFAQSQPVARAALPVSREAAASAPVAPVAAVAPVQQSVQGGAPAASASPPAPRERRVVRRATPPPPPAAFAAQQPQLAARPGLPIDEGRRRQLKPAATATVVPSVVTAAQAPAPTAAPPALPPGGRETRRGDAGRGGAARMDAAKTDATKADAAKADTAKADAVKADAAKADPARADAAKADAMKAEAARAADAAKAAAAKGDAAKAEATKAEAGRVEALRKADADKAEAAKAAAGRTDAARADAARAEAAKADAGRAEAAKGAAVRDAARAEGARSEAAKGAAAKDAARAEAAKAEAARAEAAKGAAVKAEAAKAEAARAEAAKADAARAEAAKAAAAKAEVAKADASKADASKADAAKAAAAKAAAAKAEAAKSEAAKAEAAKADAAKAEAAKGEGGKGRRGRGNRADDEKKGP